MMKMPEPAKVDSSANDPNLGWSPMSDGFSQRGRLRSRGEGRRQVFWRTTALLAALVLIAGAFAGGFIWRQAKQARSSPEEQRVAVDEPARLEARRLLDEAVRARHEERWQGAMKALSEARRQDPEIGGVDIVVGEIALEQRDAETLRHAARQALQRGRYESSAKMLLALEAWMQRGPSDAVTAGNSAKQHLAEAVESQPSNAGAFFFHGELNRLLGESAEAQRSLQAALHRQTPWQSAAVLGTKLQLAAREASEIGRPVLAPLPDAQAGTVLELCEALGRQSVVQPALAGMLAAIPWLQVVAILDDPALRVGKDERAEFAELQRQLLEHLGRDTSGHGKPASVGGVPPPPMVDAAELPAEPFDKQGDAR